MAIGDKARMAKREKFDRQHPVADDAPPGRRVRPDDPAVDDTPLRPLSDSELADLDRQLKRVEREMAQTHAEVIALLKHMDRHDKRLAEIRRKLERG